MRRRCTQYPIKSISQTLKPLFASSPLLNLIATSASARDPEETGDSTQIPGEIIHDRDLLKKTDDGNLVVLDLIDRGAIQSDAGLYSELLKKCTDQCRIREGRMLHTHLKESSFKDDAVLQNMTLNMYAKCGDMEMAREVFDEMRERDMVSYTMLITGYSQCDEFEEALRSFADMIRIGLSPNEFTFGSVLRSAGGFGCDGIGRVLHGLCIKYGFENNVYVGSALIDVYTRLARMNDARKLFDNMETKNEVSWNSLIAAYSREGDTHNAINMFLEMKRGGLHPTHFTYSSIFAACASSGLHEQGKPLHADMLKTGVKLVDFAGNTLIDMYGKAGHVEDAKKVFDRLLKKDTVSWNSMLTAYALHGQLLETITLFEDMRAHGLQPNKITFLSVLKSCSHAGLVDQGQSYFDMMSRTYKLEPDIAHYATMVDLFGRAGQLDRALKFIQEMRIEPNAVLWQALLGACRVHGNIELGCYAAERILELGPLDSGPHMLLSNTYASKGLLREAARVRKMMNDNRVKKEPACSWVEIGNSIHTFVANDDSHPNRDEIREKWNELNDEIVKLGYVADTSNVFWFADEGEREERLRYHSEKLALAFALMNAPSGSVITVKKNIRVCGDCHSAFKFVSRLVGREVVLRDTNRFHRFRDGSCSCGDYW